MVKQAFGPVSSSKAHKRAEVHLHWILFYFFILFLSFMLILYLSYAHCMYFVLNDVHIMLSLSYLPGSQMKNYIPIDIVDISKEIFSFFFFIYFIANFNISIWLPKSIVHGILQKHEFKVYTNNAMKILFDRIVWMFWWIMNEIEFMNSFYNFAQSLLISDKIGWEIHTETHIKPTNTNTSRKHHLMKMLMWLKYHFDFGIKFLLF